MKESFLAQTAQYVMRQYGNNLSQIAVILPNRRSISQFRKLLSADYTGPYLAPECLFSGDFVLRLSQMQYADYDEQMIALYEVYRNIEQQDAEPFSEFAGKAQSILQDFNEIDMCMAPMEQVYKHVYDIKNIDLWSPDSGSACSGARYLRFFEHLPLYYTHLNSYLLRSGKAYQGAVYRHVADHADAIASALPYTKVLWVGSQRLTEAEQVLLKALQQNNMLDIIVDSDEYYVNNEQHEAGDGIRRIKECMHMADIQFKNNYYAQNPKHIHIYSVPQQVAQAKYLPCLLQHIKQELHDDNMTHTAVVLPDESVMQMVYESMDWNAYNNVNVTMGYSVRNTITYELTDLLLHMSIEGKKCGTAAARVWKRDSIKALLSHPYIVRMLVHKAENVAILLKKQRKYYYQSDIETLLEQQEYLYLRRVLLCEDSMPALLRHIRQLLQHVSESQLSAISAKDSEARAEQSYIAALCEYMQRIELLLTQVEVHDEASLRLLFESYLSNCSIPFESNRDEAGLQIMGMSETKALDYDNVVILSMNEGIMPQGRAVQGLIPYEVRRAYGMPVDETQDADTAYYFYRLLQRAGHVYLLYVNDEKSGDSTPSRYLLQLKNELTEYNPLVVIEEHAVLYKLPQGQHHARISVAKTDAETAVMAHLKHSPSSLNTYRECSLQYYLNRVLNIGEQQDEHRLDIQANDMGTVVHKVLEEAAKAHFARAYSREEIDKKVREAFLSLPVNSPVKQYDARDLESGVNLLFVRMTADYVYEYMVYAHEHYAQAENIQFETETDMQCDISTCYGAMHLKGIADRVDIDEPGRVDIWDYKSGKVEESDGKACPPDKIFEINKPKALQMMMYAYMYHRIHNERSVRSVSLIPMRSITRPVGLNVNIDEDFYSVFEEQLRMFYEQHMMNKEESFSMTDKEENCKYCDFRQLCIRFAKEW